MGKITTMKKLISIALILLSLNSFGQTDDPTKYTQYKYLYGERKARLWADSILKSDGYFDIRNITTPSNPLAGRVKLYARNDSVFYRTSAGLEVYVGGSGGSSSDTYTLPLVKNIGVVRLKGLS